MAKTHFPLVVTVEVDSISVHTFDGLEVVHWVEDEWLEDPTILPSIVNAIHLAHTQPHTLLRLNLEHITSQLDALSSVVLFALEKMSIQECSRIRR